MARDVVIRDICGPKIQATVLGDENQGPKFEEVLPIIEAMEDGWRSATSLHQDPWCRCVALQWDRASRTSTDMLSNLHQ